MSKNKGAGQPTQQKQDNLNKSTNNVNKNSNDKQSNNSWSKNNKKDQGK